MQGDIHEHRDGADEVGSAAPCRQSEPVAELKAGACQGAGETHIAGLQQNKNKGGERRRNGSDGSEHTAVSLQEVVARCF